MMFVQGDIPAIEKEKKKHETIIVSLSRTAEQCHWFKSQSYYEKYLNQTKFLSQLSFSINWHKINK